MEMIDENINKELNRELEHSAYEMAKEKKLVLRNLDSLGDKISEHLGKILIYSKTNSHQQTLTHWIREIANWCQIIGGYTVKPKNKKLSIEEYKKYVFEGYAESESELNWRLTETESSNRRTDSFPPVDLSPESLKLAWITYKNISDNISKMFSDNKLYNIQEYCQSLTSLLTEYLKYNG